MPLRRPSRRGEHRYLPAAPLSPTARSTVRRGAGRARTDRAELYAVLDAGLVCHLGIVLGDAPVVLPTSTAASATPLRARIHRRCHVAGRGRRPVCVTVTHVDGVVYARSVFHHSMNYRSAVVHGRARRVTDDAERLAALRAVTEHVAPGSWDHARPPTRKELVATAVLALDLAEASVKVRTGRPSTTTPTAAGGRWPASSRSAPSSTPRSPHCSRQATPPRATCWPADLGSAPQRASRYDGPRM